ncbi:MAG: hypothetical protein ACXABF_17470 [Candidatus Thorarchaeota archaeon]|jgi:hypothetical protein
MPQPTVYDVHVDQPLTDISVAYIQSQEHFIAQQVFPVIPTDKRSDKYYTYTQADWFRDEVRPRADGTESSGAGYNVSTDSYACNVYAIHKDIGDQVVQNSDNPLNPFVDATRFLTQKMMLKQETIWVSEFFTTGIWGNDKTGGTNYTQWNNYATSDPIEDVEAGKEQILQDTGYMANTLVLGYQVFRKLKHHPDIIDRIKYTASPIGERPVTTQLLASLFEVDRVLVARSIKNSAVENATDNYSFIFGKHAMLAYVAPRPSLTEATAGYSFQWTGISKGLGTTVGMQRWRENRLAAERLEAQMAWDYKKVASNLGYFLSGAVA